MQCPYRSMRLVVDKSCVLVCLLLWQFSLHAATLDAAGAGEIQYLLSYLKSSNCQFNRNGNWYPADKAAEHLKSKYEYFLDKGELGSAESFIDKAASASSMSGKDYLVACAGHATETSSIWLHQVLARYRKDHQARK